MSAYYLYIVECQDKTLYTGITTDLQRRIQQHNSSKHGSKYTRVRQPVSLIYSSLYLNRSAASRAEYYVKQLTINAKRELIAGRIQLEIKGSNTSSKP